MRAKAALASDRDAHEQAVALGFTHVKGHMVAAHPRLSVRPESR